MKMDISNDDLIVEMQKAINNAEVEDNDDAGLTAEEWGEQWGMCTRNARKQIKILIANEIVIRGRRKHIKIDGVSDWLHVYRVK